MKVSAIILAAGQGTRMQSTLAKVLHPLLGRPMIFYALETAQQVSGCQPVVVVGHGADQVKATIGESARCVLQEPQLGTGHAVQQAMSHLEGSADMVLVLAADMPLLRVETLQKLVKAQLNHTGPMTLLSTIADQARGFGRVQRGYDGRVIGVIEEAQATSDQLLIRELNTSVYCFSAGWLWKTLPRIPLSPKGEYYLTDLVGIATADGLTVQSVQVEDPVEAIGVNNRLHLAEAEAELRRRVNTDWMLAGVSMIDPTSTYIESGVKIGKDTVIWPNTYLQGNTQIGENCTLGPNSIICDTQVGNMCEILASVLEGAIVEDEVHIGPFGHLRKGAHLGRGVHMGNFGEVKSSYLAAGVKMGHFSYIGDAAIGPDVNIGAGTITCNFDGKNKYPTEIDAEAFIGSDTMLVAPVKIGEGARTGAGSVVTKDVPAHSLAVGIPARVIRKFEKRD